MRASRVGAVLLIAHAALTLAAEEVSAPSTSGGITEISVERTRCYGTCPADTLVLHSNGKAEYTGKAFTRMSGEFAGTFWPGEFDRLAHWLVTEGFFQLGNRDRNDVLITDDTEQVIRVSRDGKQKVVTSYSSAQTEQAWVMGHVIRSIVADIKWEPAHSGIRGQILQIGPGEDRRPQPLEYIWVTPTGTQERYSFNADGEGKFEINLAPGTYSVSWRMDRSSPQTVVVEPDRFTTVDLRAYVAGGNAGSQNRAPSVPPGDGLYRGANGLAKWVVSNGNEDYLLGDAADLVILNKQLLSEGPGDSMFRLGLTVPFEGSNQWTSLNSLFLVAGGSVYKPLGITTRGKESPSVFFQIPGEARARKVGALFDIPVEPFVRPDYKLSATIVPSKQSFRRGEPITATLRIVNNGNDHIRFQTSGLSDQRDDYAFTARKDGQPLSDFSFPGDRGGTARLQYLGPAAVFVDTVDLGKWFDIKEAGTYQIHGSYKMNIVDSRGARQLIGLSTWTEYAASDFIVTIE